MINAASFSFLCSAASEFVAAALQRGRTVAVMNNPETPKKLGRG
jgi:hypothetical protein